MSQDLFTLIVLVWMGVGAATFAILLRVRAPYGKHTTSGWGPTLDHRIGWFLMELPALIVFAVLVLSGSNPKTAPVWVFFGAWQLHYVHRTLIFPVRIPDTGKRMPWVIVGSAVFFNSVNGWLNGYYIGSIGPVYGTDWLLDPRFTLGALLFVSGLAANLHSDSILLALRRSGRYEVPQGGMFRWISCPNYLGEIVEWIGFAVMTWSPAALAFAVWTAANLIPRALSNHRWYIERFDDYPSNRAALLPGVV